MNDIQVRKFKVIVARASKPNVAYPDLDGDKALRLMERLTRRGFKTLAHTQANGISETLTVSDLHEIFTY